MFGRRVFASAPLPRAMWPKLHIQNAAQASRALPSLASLTSLAGKNTSVLNSLSLAQARDGMTGIASSATMLQEEVMAAMVASSSGGIHTATTLACFQMSGKVILAWSTPINTFLSPIQTLPSAH